MKEQILEEHPSAIQKKASCLRLETPRWSSLIINHHKSPHAKLMRAIGVLGTRVAPLMRAELASGTADAPLDETRVKFDEDKIDRTVNRVRDHAHLNARRET